MFCREDIHRSLRGNLFFMGVIYDRKMFITLILGVSVMDGVVHGMVVTRGLGPLYRFQVNFKKVNGQVRLLQFNISFKKIRACIRNFLKYFFW
jgi:hypothetical protein